MKKIIGLFLLLLVALSPLVCRQIMLQETLERLNGACALLGINEREWQIEKGYLESSLSLQEPLSSVWSGRGLKPEETKFLRDYSLSLEIRLEHGPFNLLQGRQELVLALSGPAWRLEIAEILERSLSGRESRRAKLKDGLFEDGELLVSLSNCWQESIGQRRFNSEITACRGVAEQFVVLPLGGARGLSYVIEEKALGVGLDNLALGDDLSLSNVNLEASWQDRGGGLFDLKTRLDFSTISSPYLEGEKGVLNLEHLAWAQEMNCDFLSALIWGGDSFDWEGFLRGRPQVRASLEVATAQGPFSAALNLGLKKEGKIEAGNVFEALEGQLKIQGEAPLKKFLAEYFAVPVTPTFQLELKDGKVEFPGEAK